MPRSSEARAARLEVRGLAVDYGRERVVDGVDLAVGGDDARVVALLGPSGCGKSTLLRALAGIEPVAAGTVRFDGADLAGLPPHRRGFGLVFQDGQLFPHRTVAGNIAYGLRGPLGRPRGTRAERADRVEELLALVGLEGLGGRRAGELSGGQAQRVALARALAPRPRLLLLDEPLSSLDRELRDRLAVDIGRILRTTGTPALVVTHDHGEAATLAGRIAVMRAGRIVQEAPPRTLWRYPRDDETARFLGYPVLVDGEARGGTARCALGAVPVVHPDGPVRLGLRAESLQAHALRDGDARAGAEAGGPDAGGPPVEACVQAVTALPSRTLVSVRLGAPGGAAADGAGGTAADGAGGAAADVPGDVTATYVSEGAPRPGDRVRLRPVPGLVAVVTGASVREVAAGAIVRDDGRVLLARRTYPPELAGRWELPGGKVEPGETGPEGLRRELAEELGVEVCVGPRLAGEAALGGTLVLRAYRARLVAGEPEAREHGALRWADVDELGELPLVDNDRVWVDELRALLAALR